MPTLGDVVGDAGSGSVFGGTIEGAAVSGGIRVVVDGGLLEDIMEVAEGLDGGFAHVGGHLIV